ncbi:glycoside hydrolase family 31 protein [Gloeocapsopsis dulcis]|uniref:Alpha-glucosidase n=1 Tax=Gloeocapsopsis dulcis AAB1 = 1H9 TaxID=1433147 RepID=A0A6N8G056_9CHRO|nr:glycoside hydrolase family 31 protein [Gloeocapsopsis dulcis]MUL38723.1 alpha-glucosidase [Gloeocapsopsis dulcis AAB1 = 1H9]WNN88859.1 glycoside hydrolase family 31 protein [Gloeocapsopsis dulcis]
MPQYFGQLPINEQPWQTLSAIQGISQQEHSVRFDCGKSCLQINVLASNLIRVRLAPTGEFTPRRSWAVTNDAAWQIPSFEVKETETTVEIQTEQLRVVVQRKNGQIACYDSANRPFAIDADPGMGWRLGTTAAWKKIAADEHFYGFGERTGLLDKRSEVKTNWTTDALDYGSLTDEMYQAIPFFIALRPEVGYGIFFNTTFWSRFDIGVTQPGIWQMETHTGELDYYIIYGPTPAEILATYTQLTGRMPLPPKWALGYHQCRWSYESETVVRELAKEFRDRRIPCDVIHLDIDYMRGYRVFTWSPQRFPHPGKLIQQLAEDGFKTVTIIDPGVKYEPEADYSVFDQGIAHDYFIRKAQGQLFHGYVWPDKAVFPDFMRADVRQWWGELHKSLTDIGIAGIWNDMNEPAINDRPFGDEGDKIWFPLDAPQGGAREETEDVALDERVTHAEAHNLYGSMMARSCAEGLEKLRPNERSFVLTRSGYAGIQRWSSVWMGDNHSLWDHLEMSLPMLCNMGLSGVAFVGCDVGGFASNATAELFARWMQVGMLYPLMRAHSALTTAQHEPWSFGDRTEKICREYINLRYQLLPYIYTLFWEAATTGAPILRPLLYDFPNDPLTYTLHDQVLLGSSLMAAPIYRPGVEHRAVYLPEGTWYDWWSGESYTGPTHILAHAPLEKMPLYVKAGAIIPMQPVMQYVDERSLDPLTLRVWQGDGEFTLYEDDGHTFAYKDNAYTTTKFRINTEENQATFEINQREGSWLLPSREVIVELVGVGEQRLNDNGTARQLVFNL